LRVAELRGLARWRSRFQNIGLDEKLTVGVTERVGMLVVQVERFSRVAATVLKVTVMAILRSSSSSSSSNDKESSRINSLNLFIYNMQWHMLNLIAKTENKIKIAKLKLT
jgi:hypothetical protein